jgi:hypothetical protein
VDYTAQAAGSPPANDTPAADSTVTVGDTLYIGHIYNRFCRFVLSVGTASTCQVILEYWNGSWSQVPGGPTGEALYSATGVKALGRDADDYTLDSETLRRDWTPHSVNGYTYYWMRLRVTNVGNGIRPMLDYIIPSLTLKAPQALEEQTDFFGGVHEMADGSRALDGIDYRRNWRMAWPWLDEYDYRTLREIWRVGVDFSFVLYSEWIDNELDGTTVLIDPDVGLRAIRRPAPDGLLRFDCEMGIMEQ